MTLFHYCSNASFLSILKNREIVASDLSLSNDALEGKWTKHIFADLCESDPVLKPHKEKLVNNFSFLTEIAGGMGFCLSEKGDLLSQWRGYAENGAGVSIGFSKDYLDQVRHEHHGGKLVQIVYDPELQKKELSPFLDELKCQIDRGAFKDVFGPLLIPVAEEEKKKIVDASHQLWVSYLMILGDLYRFKNPAFSEESEWRLLFYIINESGQASKDAIKELDFRAASDRIIPNFRIQLKKGDQASIREIILGPRNITPEKHVYAALARNGFTNVEVTRSKASYR